jgi:hypothetical protein
MQLAGYLLRRKIKGPRSFNNLFYILEALSGAKLNYTEIEKIAYAVLISSRKLKHF